MNATTRPPTILDAYERLAAREVDVPEPELESEKERLLTDSESPEVADRYRFERLYRSAEFAGGYRTHALLAIGVLAAVGAALAFAAWWLGGFG